VAAGNWRQCGCCRAADQPAAVAVALAVVSGALKRSVASSTPLIGPHLVLLVGVSRNRDRTEGGIAYELRGLHDLLGVNEWQEGQ
jgi:hypothetical protein